MAEFGKGLNYSGLHPRALAAVSEPLDYLDDLKRAGVIDFDDLKILEDGQALNELLQGKEANLIQDDLNNCSKSAWLMPNYLAQISHRSLRKSGKYSDVSSKAYTSPESNFIYWTAYVPASIFRRFSLIPTTGLLEWWPKFINRSDLTTSNVNILPPKPNMSGNILVVFVFLIGGLSIALLCMFAELWRHVLGCTIAGWNLCFTKYRTGVNKCRLSSERPTGRNFIFVKSRVIEP